MADGVGGGGGNKPAEIHTFLCYYCCMLLCVFMPDDNMFTLMPSVHCYYRAKITFSFSVPRLLLVT